MGVYDYELPDFMHVDPADILPDLLAKPVAPYVPPAPVDDRSEFSKGVSRGVEGLKSTAYGAAGMVGSGLGIDSLRDWGYEGFLEHEEEAAKHAGRVQNIEDIGSIKDAADWAAGTFGSLVPSIAEAGVTSLAGAAIGSAAAPGPGTAAGAVTGVVGKTAVKSAIRKLAREYVKKGTERQLAKQMAKEAIESLPAKALYRNLGTKAGIVAGTAPIEAGGMWGEGMQQGVDNPYSAAILGTLSGFSELVGGEAELIDIFTNPARQALKGSLIKRMGTELGKSIPQEALQEATQESLALINRKIVDPNFELTGEEARSRLLNSAAAGALGGVAFGGVAGLTAKGERAPGVETTDQGDVSSSTPTHEPDPWKAPEEPPHPVVTAEAEENPVLPPVESMEPEGPKPTLTRALEAAGTAAPVTVPAIDTMAVEQDGSGSGRTNELVLDEARAWAAEGIKAGNTSLMQQHGEPPTVYGQRLVQAYQKSQEVAAPPQQIITQSGPKYANELLVNPETGVAEMVRPEELADRLKQGFRPPGFLPAGTSETLAPAEQLSAGDRTLLSAAQERAGYWERGSVTNGRSNKTELFPWLASWGKTTPAEVSQAIGNYLAGKKLGEVQQRLVSEALTWERENRTPRGAAPIQSIADLIGERRRNNGPASQTAATPATDLVADTPSNISDGLRSKAARYAQKAGIDITDWTEADLTGFVTDYEKYVGSKSRATAPVTTIGDLIRQRREQNQRTKGTARGETGQTDTAAAGSGRNLGREETAETVPEGSVSSVDGQQSDGVPVLQPANGQADTNVGQQVTGKEQQAEGQRGAQQGKTAQEKAQVAGGNTEGSLLVAVDAIPEGLEVVTTMIREKTGEQVTMLRPARQTLERFDATLDMLRGLLECVT